MSRADRFKEIGRYITRLHGKQKSKRWRIGVLNISHVEVKEEKREQLSIAAKGNKNRSSSLLLRYLWHLSVRKSYKCSLVL